MFCSTVNKAKSGGRQLSGDVEGPPSSLSLSEESREIHIAVSSVLKFCPSARPGPFRPSLFAAPRQSADASASLPLIFEIVASPRSARVGAVQ